MTNEKTIYWMLCTVHDEIIVQALRYVSKNIIKYVIPQTIQLLQRTRYASWARAAHFVGEDCVWRREIY